MAESDRWERVQSIFHAALERPRSERQAFLDQACAGDQHLRDEVQSLLGHHADGVALEGGAVVATAPPEPGALARRRLGSYVLGQLLGIGGMGEVYRARDSKLGRDVAIKILPPAFAQRPDRLARFAREARVLAALNHPHIGAIYGFEEDGSLSGLVLELLEGHTLATRLAAGPLPAATALDYGVQIADALAAAHAKGIVHRDLKPANVALSAHGVKVIDFGLAKADLEALPSVAASMSATREGMVLGTAPYMSPEQARGMTVDARTDVWALGCVLYEMLTGGRAFPGDSVADAIGAVINKEPDYRALPADTPRAVRRIIEQCLAKDPAERPSSMAQVRDDLHAARHARGSSRWLIPAVTALASVAAIVILVTGLRVWIARRAAPPGSPAAALTPSRVNISGGISLEPALSPDGSAVAFVSDRSGASEIYVVGLARGSQEIRITSDGKNSVQPAWSPDGRWIAYARNDGRGLWLVPATGGTPRQLADVGSNPVWSPDSNSIAFTTQSGVVGQSNLRVVGRDGSGLRDLTHLGAPIGGHRSPAWSNNGRFIAFATVRGADEASLWIVDAAGGAPRRLRQASDAANLQFSPDDRTLFFTGTGNVLYRLAIDAVRGTAGEQAPEPVLSLPGEFDGISMSRSGLMAYGLASTDTNLWTVDLGPGGEVREPTRLTDDAVGRTTRPEYSPDGKRLAYMQGASRYEANLWVMNADGTDRSQLITEGGGAGNLSWAPDGTRVLVQRDTSGARTMWWLELDTRRLTPLDLVKNARNPRLSPDGREMAYWMVEKNGTTNTFAQAIDGSEPRRITSDAESINYPVWSPDGRWLAVGIKRGKDTHVGIVSRSGGPVDQITNAPGLSGANSWSPDGDQIAFAGLRDGVWNVWTVSRRTRVSRQLTHFTSPSDYVGYPSWSPDGHRIAFERGIRRGSVWTVQVR